MNTSSLTTVNNHDPRETRVVVGMSGGVDSSVSAHVLQKQGYHVTGLFMKNWEEDDTQEYCAAAQDLKDAAQVCDRLGIELQEVNFAHEYWENVFSHFLDEYQAGRTPNPDILCNKEIKFKEFLLQAEAIGANYIATGHYVAKGQLNDQQVLLRGADSNKDQSYFLYTLQQEALQKSLFPLGEIVPASGCTNQRHPVFEFPSGVQHNTPGRQAPHLAAPLPVAGGADELAHVGKPEWAHSVLPFFEERFGYF